MQTVILVDTFGFLFRSYFALPPLKNKEGFPTGLLMGFGNLIMNLYKNYKGSFLVFAMEGGDNKRKQAYPEYKANRQELPEDLALQIPVVFEWIKKMRLNSVEVSGYEADDVIASLAKQAHLKGLDVQIQTHDKDLYQLISPGICIYDPIRRVEITSHECFKKFGVYPENFIDYQSLIGDSSDNVPGVAGIGKKTAQRLIEKYKTLEQIYKHIDSLEEFFGLRVKQKLLKGRSMAFLSKELVCLNSNLLQDFDFGSSVIGDCNPLEMIVDDLEKYEFHRLLSRSKKTFSLSTPVSSNLNMDFSKKSSQSTFHFTSNLISDFDGLLNILDSIPKGVVVAYDSETNSLDATRAKIVGFSFCWDGVNGYYVPINHEYLGVQRQISMEDARFAIQKLFDEHILVGHNIKYDLIVARKNFGISSPIQVHDTMILAWLLDSGSLLGLDHLMEKFFSHKMIAFGDVVGDGGIFSGVELNRASEYASEDAVATLNLYQKFCSIYRNRGLDSLLDLANKLEYPLINVLLDMEIEGVSVDVDWFYFLQKELKSSLALKEADIFASVGEAFNLNSPKQLSKILFETLGLKGKKRVKGGFSTDEQSLEDIYDDHLVVPMILEYRSLFKLKNAYVEPILKLRTQEDRIHTSFLQTGTTTGRLSSRTPNLQNIPVRTESGRQVRRGFIATKGKKLLSVDYSQIELRLLAHFSKDPNLVSAFNEGADVHLKTAQMLFGDSLCVEKRPIAKTINFGLIYGMGSRKLAQTLKISVHEAKKYIESYFNSFPTVKEFLNAKEEEILRLGYAQTLLGHRRYFNFHRVSEFVKKNFLREGINAIFQGSAADLIKLSMIEIHRLLRDTSARMLIQVHDELIFEMDERECGVLSKEIEKIMNHVYPLNIPLQCNIGVGDNWSELK